ncbi:hypothetical protein ZEAMMB73_Zm00001d028652 [Zea mays]|uniref:Myb/SANT-like domain-containing protein n=1 Tax=Zea mays TaxID=4577 RepID=A0A1D6JY94_MAIZE|nr:hypothetical protein ZEAMMB73_Zm00001d028652 [Zea mays]
MSPNRANWDEATTKIFLDLCIVEKNLTNWNSLGLTKQGWQHVYRSFKEQTGLNYDHKQMQNKLSTLRRSFLHWRSLQTHTGLGRDSNTGAIEADDSYWGTQQGDPSTPQANRGKPPPFLDELHTLFGRTTQDRGNLISAGGVRDASLNYGSEDTPPYLSNDHAVLRQSAMSSQQESSQSDTSSDASSIIYQLAGAAAAIAAYGSGGDLMLRNNDILRVR